VASAERFCEGAEHVLRSYGKAIVLRFLPTSRVAELSSEEQAIYRQLDPARLPQHVAIIMDGNGRWAV
jgi:hypothetical protein